MAVLINGIEMPTCCVLCRMSEYHVTNPYCKITEAKILRNRDRNNDCPLVPVPPHGDLIDYDFCMKNYELLHDDNGNPVYAVRMRDINNAPTVIPAEEGA